MEASASLEKVWQLSDDHELLKSTFEGRVTAHLALEGRYLVFGNGRAMLGVSLKNIFKKRPLFAFTLKADDCLSRFTTEAPENDIEAVKNPFFLKAFFKNVEPTRKPRRQKGESFGGMVDKLREGKHLLGVSDILTLFAVENLRKQSVVFRSFQCASSGDCVYCLLETNLEDWIVYSYNEQLKSGSYQRLSTLPDFPAKAKPISACFVSSNNGVPTVWCVCQSRLNGLHLVCVRLGPHLATAVACFVFPNHQKPFDLRILGGMGESFYAWDSTEVWRVDVAAGWSMSGRSSKDSVTSVPLSLRQTLGQHSEPFFAPIQTEVRNQVLYFLWPTRMYRFDCATGLLEVLHDDPMATFRRFVLRDRHTYLLDRHRIVFLSSPSPPIFFEVREFDLLLDLQVSPNEFLLFVFGKRGDLFSHRTDLAVFRGRADVASTAATCEIAEFLLFASNSFKIQIKRSVGVRTKSERLEVAKSPFFGVLANKPPLRVLQLKAAYFRFSNDPVSFGLIKTEFFRRFGANSELLGTLLGGGIGATCPIKGCKAPLKGFEVAWFRTTFACSHVVFFAPDVGELVAEGLVEAHSCLKCQTVHARAFKCLLCSSTL